ncbi:hypothetical protein TNCV_1452741 [Trichonephila clavipes]|nr:hypothetical protein TNCV_1452741 [Trichonephila clavipes]
MQPASPRLQRVNERRGALVKIIEKKEYSYVDDRKMDSGNYYNNISKFIIKRRSRSRTRVLNGLSNKASSTTESFGFNQIYGSRKVLRASVFLGTLNPASDSLLDEMAYSWIFLLELYFMAIGRAVAGQWRGFEAWNLAFESF